MGVVFLVQHLSYDTQVAIKTPILSKYGPHTLACLTHEIQLLRRLTHPGIVPLLQHGHHEGFPYLVMPFLSGATLGSLLPRLEFDEERTLTFTTVLPEAVPAHSEQHVVEPRRSSSVLSLQQVLDLMRALCEPLAYLHQEGIVHRDLKPDNIILGADGMPVLLDFGLSVAYLDGQRRELLAVRGGAQGTAAYTAPEQWRGQRPDPRADLYAFGCILYRALTGRPPFVGHSPEVLMRAHLREPVVPPSLLNPQLSPELDALVMRLLAKQPEARFEYALDVAAALERVGAQPPSAWHGKLPELYPYLHGAPFMGQEENIQRLKRALLRVQQDRGGLVSLIGVAGTGKTRLLNECLTQALTGSAEVLVATCQSRHQNACGGPGGLQPLIPFLSMLVHQHLTQRAPWTQRLLEPQDLMLCALEPRLSLLLGPTSAGPEPVGAPLQLVECMLSLLERVARHLPLVLVFDDVHHLDGMTLLLLEKLRQRPLESLPILLVLAARSERLSPALERLLSDARNECLELRRLFSTTTSLQELLWAQVPGLAPTSELLNWLLRQSAGNPYFLNECLRRGQDLGWLERQAPGLWRFQPLAKKRRSLHELPASLRRLLEDRLNLSRSGFRLLRRALLLSAESTTSLFQLTLADEQAPLLEILQQLFLLEVLEVTDDGRLRLTHDALRGMLGLPGEPSARFRVSGGGLPLSSLRHGFLMGDAPQTVTWTLADTSRQAPRAPPRLTGLS